METTAERRPVEHTNTDLYFRAERTPSAMDFLPQDLLLRVLER